MLETRGIQYLKPIAPSVPYLAVVIGLYGLDSAWSSMLLYHVGIVFILLVANYWRLGAILKTRSEFIVLIAVIVISATSGFVIYWLWPEIKLEQLLLTSELADLGLSGTVWLFFMIYYATINPLLEELYWRGYLGSDSTFLIWNDVWFAGYHILVLVRFIQLSWVVASFIILVGAAWFWRQLARRYNGLFMPIASHTAADASIVGGLFFLLG